MKSNEKKLVGLALLLLLALITVRVVPSLKTSYEDGLKEIELLEQQIARLQFMVEEFFIIQDREASRREDVAVLESLMFTGQEPNLIGSGVQRQLRQAVDEAGLLVRQYSTPRFIEIDGWLLVVQEMDFVIEQEKILQFLNLLENSSPKLHITEFNISRNRRQYTGSITVTGFSKQN